MLTDIVKSTEESVCDRVERVAAELYRLKPSTLVWHALRTAGENDAPVIEIACWRCCTTGPMSTSPGITICVTKRPAKWRTM